MVTEDGRNTLYPDEWKTSPPDESPADEDDGLPAPTGFRMLVKPVVVESRSPGGIVLVEESKQYADLAGFVGLVLKQGPDCYRGERFSGPWCRVGDHVAYARHVGQKIDVKSADGTVQKLVIINDDDVRAVVKDPARIRMYV